jgi:hypothetical protein
VIVVWVCYLELLVDKIKPLFKKDAVNNSE